MTITEGIARNGDIELPWIRTSIEDGEPLLLVNGLSSPLVSYDDGFVAELNSQGFDVVRFDNRDAGRATSTNGGYFLVDQAADAIQVLDAVGWSTAHVFGMSMGGMIVQQLGISFGDRLRSITSLMSSTGNPEIRHIESSSPRGAANTVAARTRSLAGASDQDRADLGLGPLSGR